MRTIIHPDSRNAERTRAVAGRCSCMERRPRPTFARPATLLEALVALIAATVVWLALAAVPTALAQAPAPGPANAAPVPSFTFAPSQPLVGQAVSFTSTATDSDGTIVHEAWDLDGDGKNDATGHTATWSYATAGPKEVRLRARDNAGVTRALKAVVVVTAVNRPPSAAFDISPAAPVAGQAVTFSSLSTDPDGAVSGLSWDLNGDGTYGDAVGARGVWTFQAAGSFTVGLRVTDDKGASSLATQTVTVRGAASAQDAPSAPRPGNSAPGASPLGPTSSPGTSLPVKGANRLMISPFPVVRIRGHASGKNVVIDLLSVRAPRGTTVTVRCAGPACPRLRMTARAVSATTPVRLRPLERRYRPGTVLEVFVARSGRIGKYVRFTIRDGRAPARTDRCLRPGGTQPISCPAQ
ncbi:MAG: hypothetical protein QOC64_1097 [Solirubrobacteraceae bacterium]|nr:hypothetical protein [Solirubrobacteraceae bacterium]